MLNKTLIALILTTNILFAQYYGERTTEQNFELSQMYFNSQYLNPYGILNFKDVALGLIDDNFLNLQLNPATLPDLGKDKDVYLYLDFRGDRTEEPVVQNYVYPAFYDVAVYRPYIDPRFITHARSEPEPIVSIGLITYPISDITKNFFIGGTYQLIYREEKFYSLPYFIYNPRYYYDALGVSVTDKASIPIDDRYSGKDEMTTEAHLFSAFAGYKFTDKLSFGLNLSAVTNSREGGYQEKTSDEYTSTNNPDWLNNQSRDRVQDYDHLDFSGGVKYDVSPKFSIGLKAGILDGTADQSYNSVNYYYYKSDIPEVSETWSYNLSNSTTDQKWHQDGTTKYFGFNFSKLTDDNLEIRGYYKFSSTNIDLSNFTTILDTSFYTSRWAYDTTWGQYSGTSSAQDLRKGIGTREKTAHEVMLNLKWAATSSSFVTMGLYLNSSNTSVNTTEPVNAFRSSHNNYQNSEPDYNHNYTYSLLEKKTLEWNYESQNLTLQIPIILQFRFDDVWSWMIGLNRILNNWKITDQTTAYFDTRERNENGTITSETNFGERYTQPREKITENFTKFFTGVDLRLSSSFKVKLLLDPEFEHKFRLAQWWLSVEAFL